jgi:hypothetical protein
LSSGWRVGVRLSRIDGRPVVSSVTLDAPADRPHAPINAKVWRSVPIGAVVDAAFENYRHEQEIVEEADRQHADWIAAWAQAPGRTGHSDEMYARLARQYASLSASGYRNPVAILQHSMGTSRSTMSQRLQTARDRGLLDGAELTSKAKTILGIAVWEKGY